MNEHVREALEYAVYKINVRIRQASEAVHEAKRQTHKRDSELAELYRQRRAIVNHLQGDE